MRLIGPPEMAGEHIALTDQLGVEEVIALHDYRRLYHTPGLYEHIVQELLGCTSPRLVADGLFRAIEQQGLAPADVTLLDLGAGTGLVGELVAQRGVTDVIGLDSLEDARQACLRDRPAAYRDYLVGDLADPDGWLIDELAKLKPTAMTGAGAFGGKHAAADTLQTALELLPAGAPVAFTIAEQWTQTDGPGAFRTPLEHLIDAGTLRLIERTSFKHRVSTTGEPILYELFVGTSGGRP